MFYDIGHFVLPAGGEGGFAPSDPMDLHPQDICGQMKGKTDGED